MKRIHFLNILTLILIYFVTYNSYLSQNAISEKQEQELLQKIETLEEQAENEDENGQINFEIAHYKTELGEYEDALMHYNKAEKNGLKNYQLYHNRGALKERLRDFDGAIQDFTSAIAIEPEALSYNDRGQVYHLNKEYEKAISDFKKAIELDKTWSTPHSNIAIAYKYVNKLDESLKHYEEALRLSSNDYRTRFNMGLLLMKMEKFEKAIEAFSFIQKTHNSMGIVYVYRAHSYASLGSFDLACSDFQTAKELGEDVDPELLNGVCNQGTE